MEEKSYKRFPFDASSPLMVSMFDSAPVMIWVSDVDKLCIYFNRPWLEFAGRDLSAEIGNGWVERVHPDDVQDCWTLYNTAFDSRQKFTMEYRLLNSQGHYRWVLDNGVPYYGPEGDFLGYIGSAIDITSQKDIQSSLHHSEKKYRTLVENLNEGVWVIDQEAITTFVNPKMAQIMGYSIEEMLGRHLFSFMEQEVIESCRQKLEKRRQGILEEHDFTFTRKDGTRLFTRVATSPIFDEKGQYLGSIAGIIDITESHRVAEQLRQSEEFARAVLNSLIAHVAVVDSQGHIIAVNDAWRQFAEQNGGVGERKLHLGANYLSVCQTAIQASSDVFATKAMQGIRDVMEGVQKSFVMEYPCHSMEEERWFSLNVQPFTGPHGWVVVSHENITARKKAEETVLRKGAELKAIYEHAPVLMCTLDAKRQVLYANRAFTEFTGISESELIKGRACGIFGCINAADDPQGCGFGKNCQECSLRWAIQDTFMTGSSHQNIEYNATLEQKGVCRQVHLLGSTALIAPLEKPTLLLCLHDMTERKRAEDALRISEARYHSVVNTMAEGVVIHDHTGMIIDANASAQRILGLTLDQIKGKTSIDPMWNTIREDGSPFPGDVHPAMVTLRTGRAVLDTTMGVKKNDGTLTWILINSQPLFNKGAQLPYAAVATFSDITERKMAADELRESREQIRALGVRYVEAEENERKRIVGELHDQIGQSLSALTLNIDFVCNKLSLPSEDSVQQRLTDSLKILEQTTTVVRNMMAVLRPTVLDDYGIEAALRWYADQFESRSCVQVEITSDLNTRRLNGNIENCLFRVAQEALTNVMKHAKASKVWIWLHCESSRIQMEIADDGRGFDWAQCNHKDRFSFGLLTMKERVLGLGGSFKADSCPGRGVVIGVELPL